jgi:hypothetical protein
MFLTTHSVFEEVLLVHDVDDRRARARSDRGGRTRGRRRGTVPGSARRGAGVAGRAHKELTDTRVRGARVCALCARAFSALCARRGALPRVRWCRLPTWQHVHPRPCRVGAAER